MYVGTILNLLNELNKIILCEPLESIFFNEIIKFDIEPTHNIKFITYLKKRMFSVTKRLIIDWCA
jgi:hypothetical protein